MNIFRIFSSPHKSLSIIIPLFLLTIFPTKSFAATINVPGDQATIADAITAASAGDTISVAVGTYTLTAALNIDKEIILQSASGDPTNTIIQGPAAARILDISGSGDESTIQGFTFAIVSTTANAAAAIYTEDANIDTITITNNIFYGSLSTK